MNPLIQHAGEKASNEMRKHLAQVEPKSLRTYTPSQAILSQSSGVFHWTPEGRRLYDYSSGVLVANLGHNPVRWARRFFQLLGWDRLFQTSANDGFFDAHPMTAYNAVTGVEIQASEMLVEVMSNGPGGRNMQQVLWAASGSEGIQKALWVALAKDKTRDMIIATRFGFHGKKGLANAVTGSENDRDRDPRVKFISFPMAECADVSLRDQPFDSAPFRAELDALWAQYGRKLAVLITEPYLGGGGSYHPPKQYLQMLEQFCREKDLVFIMDEVQANFGRTERLFAFQTYGLEPDMVVLGKGLGNGVPVAAVVGRADLFASLGYGEGSDTWSANPICCSAVIATLEEFADGRVLANSQLSSKVIEEGLLAFKRDLPFVANIRGEKNGMVWGVEMKDWGGKSSHEWACAMVEACYQGDAKGEGVHLLGPLAQKVVRISPPLVITPLQAAESVRLMHQLLLPLAQRTAKQASGTLATS